MIIQELCEFLWQCWIMMRKAAMIGLFTAYELVKQTGPKVEAAIAQIQSECDCVVLTKAAVVAGNARDFTGQAKSLLGLDAVDAQAIRARVKDAMASKVGTAAGGSRTGLGAR